MSNFNSPWWFESHRDPRPHVEVEPLVGFLLSNPAGEALPFAFYSCYDSAVPFRFITLGEVRYKLPTALDDDQGTFPVCGLCPHQLQCTANALKKNASHPVIDVDTFPDAARAPLQANGRLQFATTEELDKIARLFGV